MKNYLLAVLAALCLSLASFAQDNSQFVDVIAIGVGMTQDEAMKTANKAAVEQVVGTMVDATTLAENDELVEDRILTYSAGLIADSKIIGTPKQDANGLITVKVKATVRKTALREKLVAEKLVSVQLDGQSLFAQAISAQNNLADAEAMIKDVLAKHLACVVAEPVPGQNGSSPLDYDPKTGEVFANVKVHIDMAKYRQFIKEVFEKLGPMSVRKVTVSGIHDFGDNSNWLKFPVQLGTDRNSRPQPLLLLGDSRGANGMILLFDRNNAESIASAFHIGQSAISVAILDRNGFEIGRSAVSIAERRNSDFNWEKISLTGCSSHVLGDGLDPHVIAPFIGFSCQSDMKYNYQTKSRDTCEMALRWRSRTKSMPPSERTFRVSLGSFTPDELKSAGKLDIKVGHMKDGQFTE